MMQEASAFILKWWRRTEYSRGRNGTTRSYAADERPNMFARFT